MKQSTYSVITDKRTLPFNETATGTVSTFGKAVVGVGTLFETEMKAGSWIVDLTNWEMCRVNRVDTDLVAFMDTAFTSDLASAALVIIPWYKAYPKEISIEIDAANAAGLLNDADFTGILTISKASSDRSARKNNIDPVMVDASGTEMKINILY